MNKRAILRELFNGNPFPLQKLKPVSYDFLDNLDSNELEALYWHQMGVTLMDGTEIERITNKAFMKPVKQTTEAE